MIIRGTRFGDVEVDNDRLITFPNGIIGFQEDKEYVLLEPRSGRAIGHLQSVSEPALSFPVMDGAALAPEYPQPDVLTLATRAGIECDQIAILIVVHFNPISRILEANLAAPLLIDVVTRTGFQAILDPRCYPTRLPLYSRDEHNTDTISQVEISPHGVTQETTVAL